MKTPFVVICAVLVGILGFLVVYSQTGLPEKTAAAGGEGAGYGSGQGSAGGYGGGAPSGGYGH